MTPRPGFPKLPCKHAWGPWSAPFRVHLREFRNGRYVGSVMRKRRTCMNCDAFEEEAS